MATTYSSNYNLPMQSRLDLFSNWQKNERMNLRQRPAKPSSLPSPHKNYSQEEANRLHIINQSVIGAKEGVVEAVLKLVGSDITDAVLRTVDCSNHKSIDDFMLYEVMKVAIDGADWPSTNDVMERLLKVINHTFNFCKKVSDNMELMQSNVARMATYGIVIGIPQLMLTLLANIKTATKSSYGRECFLTMHAIHKKYMYDQVHDATSLQTILTELVGANGVRALKDAPAWKESARHLHQNIQGKQNHVLRSNRSIPFAFSTRQQVHHGYGGN